MEFIKLLLVVIHVSAAALLFGAPLGVVRMARSALAKGEESFKFAAQEAARRGKLTFIAALVTLVTGLSLIFMIGGFALAPKNFHTALLLLLLGTVFSVAWMKPNTTRLVQASEQSPLDRAAAEKALGKLGMGSGILQALWLVVLTLMFFRF
jgi:hypothetical protein